MRHPSENYIKYLVSLPTADAQKDEWVRWSVETLGLPRVDPTLIQNLRGQVTAQLPASFDPSNRFHRQSMKLLRAQGIWSLWHRDESVELAISLLTDFKARDMVQKQLLGRLEPIDIAKKVNSRLQRFYTEKAIQAFEHYFWNVQSLTPAEWSALFDLIDPRREEVLALLAVGPAMALRLTGFQQHIETKTMLREMMSGIYFDYKRWEAQPLSVDRTDAMAKLARTAVQLDNQLSQSDAAIKDALKSFEMFRMETSASRVTDISKLTPDGAFSRSGAKLLEAESTTGGTPNA